MHLEILFMSSELGLYGQCQRNVIYVEGFFIARYFYYNVLLSINKALLKTCQSITAHCRYSNAKCLP